MLELDALVSDIMPVAVVALAKNHNFVVRGEDFLEGAYRLEANGPRFKNLQGKCEKSAGRDCIWKLVRDRDLLK